MSYYQINSHLTLSAMPENPMHAVPKQYVDNKAGQVDGSRFLQGTLSISKLPGFSGDVTAPEGRAELTLVDVHSSPKEYQGFTVDAKGRVISGTAEHHTEGRAISWNSVRAAPTTLNGFGIDDVLSTTGGTLNTPLASSASPSSSLHAIHKTIVDQRIETAPAAPTIAGDIYITTSDQVPPNHFRANGGVLSKSEYSTLYQKLGPKFDIKDAWIHMGSPWLKGRSLNSTPTDGNLGAWAFESNALPHTASNARVAVTKNKVYLFMGNHTAPTPIANTAYANIDPATGQIGPWSSSSTISPPVKTTLGGCLLIGNYLYYIGGESVATTTSVSNVYRCSVLENGDLGSWELYGQLPFALSCYGYTVFKNRVWLIGGRTIGSAPNRNTVLTAVINADHSLGSWENGPTLPATIRDPSVVVTDKSVIVVGGYMNNDAAISNNVYINRPTSDGTPSTWETSPNTLPTPSSLAAVFTYKNKIFRLGGYTAITGNFTNVIQFADLNVDGTVGSWTTSTNTLPFTVTHSQLVFTSKGPHLLGANDTNNGNRVVSLNLAGSGINDYVTEIQNALIIDSERFRLPDFSKEELESEFYYYVKY